MSKSPDVLIIGGGPAGSTIGTFLARRNWRVVLLDKDKHPRFHIGESLLPMNLPILDRLGVLGDLKEIAVKKNGADFSYSSNPLVYRTYNFSRALGDTPDHAFQVRRDVFDHMLIEHCRRGGVEVKEQTTVFQVNLDGVGPKQVLSRDADGYEQRWTPRFVVDASGRNAFMASTNGWKRKNPLHASVAIYGHFKGVKHRSGNSAGNISVYWFPHGWIWMIPLGGDVMSVGVVCWPEYVKERHGNLASFFWQTLALCPALTHRIEGACAVSPIRVSGNYSYRSSRMYGNGYLLIGDAFAFIDPVFSSGVYLAMHSAEGGVSVVENWLHHQKKSFRSSCRTFERETRSGLSAYSWFIYRFTSPAMRSLFARPRNTMKIEQAVTSMLAGDVFSNPTVRGRLTLFRFIYRLSWLRYYKESLRALRYRLRNASLVQDKDNEEE